MQNKWKLFFIIFALVSLNGCVGYVWTGASLIYNRHNIYKGLSDFQILASIQRDLYKDTVFKCKSCYIDVGVVNGDVLLAGHVPNKELKAKAKERALKTKGIRRFFNLLTISKARNSGLEDSWITASIKSRIIADSSINPKDFKVITSDRVVYLMGNVLPDQAKKVIYISRTTDGVRKVVKLMRYYKISNKM